MMGLLLLAMSIPVPCDGEVSLSDGDRFAMSGVTARYLWTVSKGHAAVMREKLAGWNSPDALAAWEMECEYRSRCWYLLDDVLFCQISAQAKLRSLKELKRLVGDAAYYSGNLPAPVCSYRPYTR